MKQRLVRIADYRHDLKSEPVIMFMAYGMATALVHSWIGQLLVSIAYCSVALLSAIDSHHERMHHCDD